MYRWASRHRGRAEKGGAPESARYQEVLIVCHSGDLHGLSVMENICTGLEFAKIRFCVLDLQRQKTWPSLERFSSVVLCTEMIWELDSAKAARLENHVRTGGGLLVAYRCWHEQLSELFGAGVNGPEPDMHLTSGLHFEKEVFPGIAGLTIDDHDWLFEHSRFDIEPRDLSPEVTTLASDLAGRPILWTRTFGEGRLGYWNTGVLFCRALRGFIIQTILGTMRLGVGAIAGFGMFHVDDFPTSLSDARLEPVTREFPDLDWNGFFFGVWHEDMMALRDRHGLRYTWYTVMNYHDVDTADGADPLASAAVSGQEILAARFEHVRRIEAGDEYGFHGYNHEPMTAESWPSLATVRTKLEAARRLWETTVPAPMPTSWVPANNWYHAEHVRILKEVFPELSAICGLFSSGEPEFGEYREFGPEPWEPSLLCLPRETYGYVLKPELQMMMLSQIAGMGIWTHFVHPDDVYDIPTSPSGTGYNRNPDELMWRARGNADAPGLLAQLDGWLGRVTSAFPWLEFLTSSQAESRYRNHLSSTLSILATDDRVQIRTSTGGLFYVRTGKDIALSSADGGEVLGRTLVADGVLHVVKCAEGGASFDLATKGALERKGRAS